MITAGAHENAMPVSGTGGEKQSSRAPWRPLPAFPTPAAARPSSHPHGICCHAPIFTSLYSRDSVTLSA